MNTLIETLRKFDVLRDDDRVTERGLPGRPPDLAPKALDALPVPFQKALKRLGIEALYTYQHDESSGG